MKYSNGKRKIQTAKEKIIVSKSQTWWKVEVVAQNYTKVKVKKIPTSNGIQVFKNES